MRIGVAAGSGIRGYVLADVLRRYAELRGATAWVVAPSLGGLSRLNVAPPAMETGPVDVMVSVAKTVGVVPADDLAARLLLLASPPQVPVSLTQVRSPPRSVGWTTGAAPLHGGRNNPRDPW